MTTTEAFNPSAAPVPVQHSPWHSPVPYLFGGLAAMLGLIAFALLMLACSYWKLSGHFDSSAAERDIEAGDANSDEKLKAPPVFDERILVIMAGQEKPTFLATPVTSRASSFASNGSCSCSSETAEKSEEESEKPKQGSVDQREAERWNGKDTCKAMTMGLCPLCGKLKLCNTARS